MGAQHDSQKILAFLLDKLHEDLNQVREEPYVDMTVKTEGRSDKVKKARVGGRSDIMLLIQEIAEETWLKHKLRNHSIIAHLFQGQFKSTLHCPDCDKVCSIFRGGSMKGRGVQQGSFKPLFYNLYK